MSLHVAIAGWLLGAPSGANVRLLKLVEAAARQLGPGERLTLLHRTGNVPPTMPGVEPHPVPIPAGPAWRRALAERRLLPTILRDVGATVLDHGFLPLPPVPIPTCLLVHDVRAAHGLSSWPRWIARAALRRSCARASAVVVPSAWTAARLRDLVAPDLHPIVVPNGTDLPPTAPLTAAPTAPTAGYLLHVGHLEPRKNLDVVVQALATITPAQRPQLWLAGRAAGAGAHLHRLVDRLSLGPHVRFLGVVPDSDIQALYQGARAIVVPSVHEGFGLCALEGLAHGRPVLASRAGALPEVLGGCGVLLPADDPAAWAAALTDLAPDTSALLAARRARAAAFAWATAATRLLAVWRSLHEGRRTR